MLIKDRIYNIFLEACRILASDGQLPGLDVEKLYIEVPKDLRNGDFSTPFALENARILKKSPLLIAEIIKEYLEGEPLFAKIEIAKPGFINFFLSSNFLSNNLFAILESKDDYGKIKKDNPKKINIEFVSANPTGPLNIVSARAAAIGDSLANLLEASGDLVDREFYVNDYGNQVDLLGQSVLARLKELRGESVEFPEDGYQGEYLFDIARHLDENYKDQIDQIKDQEELAKFISRQAIEYNVQGQKEDLASFNVVFQNWFRENQLHQEGLVLKTFNILEEKKVIYDQENKKIFKSTRYGDDKDRVVIRDDGRPTYLLADIAYHNNKLERGYDLLIDIWGPDHHGYIKRLQGAMEVLGLSTDDFQVLIAQQVNLISEGEIVKMSKRLGQFSTMKDLLNEIGPDVARYFFVMRSLESHLDFDLVLAKKNSSENPVFYLQYAHARICSIFQEAAKRGIVYNFQEISSSPLQVVEAITLLKKLLIFPDEIFEAAEAKEPHRLASYLLKLAQTFHKFYTEHRIISEDQEKTNSFLGLAEGTRIVLRNGLKLLGVSAPRQM